MKVSREMLKSRTVSVFIKCPTSDVYGYVSDPRNLPNWAAGLCNSIRQEGEACIADGPMGEVKLRFAEGNLLGVLDHYVVLPNGDEWQNPLRVVPNESGAEVMFTLFQAAEMSDLQFVEDCATVENDLRTLKRILEG